MSSLFTPSALTSVQIAALATPATGVVVFDTTLTEYQIYDGTQWHCMAERSPNTANYTQFNDGTNRVEFYAGSLRYMFISAGQFWINTIAEFKGRVFIGATGFSGDASARLEVLSTTEGFLPPRMTTTQRDAIGTPAAGLMIYNTTTAKLNVYTTAWEAVTSV